MKSPSLNPAPSLAHGLAAVAVLAASRLALPPTALPMAFAFWSAPRAARATRTRNVDPSPLLQSTTTTMPPPSLIVPRRVSSLVAFGSLRVLLELSPGDDGDDEAEPEAENFRRLMNFSRSKFADTKSRSRSVYGTGSDDEEGLHRDRLRTFSFATGYQRSMSEGGGESVSIVEVVSDGDRGGSEEEGGTADNISVREISDDDGGDGGGENMARNWGEYGDEMIANDFYNMVGINYSRLKYPIRKKVKISDEEDSLGLHGDRLSTFSFSAREAEMRSRSQTKVAGDNNHDPAGGEGDKYPVHEESVFVANTSNGNGAEEEDEKGGENNLSAGRTSEDDEHDCDKDETMVNKDRFFYDNEMAADDFNDMVGIHYRRRKSPVQEREELSAREDSLGLHGDRLSTFSFSAKEAWSRSQPKEEEGVDYGVIAAAATAAATSSMGEKSARNQCFDQSFSVDNFHNNVNINTSRMSPPSNHPNPSLGSPDGQHNHGDRLSTFSLSSMRNDMVKGKQGATRLAGPKVAEGGGDEANHDDRLGTFSFASTGSWSTRGDQEGQQKSMEEPGELTPNSVDAERAYTPPRNGSLSSIAFSVPTRMRSDRA